MKGCVQLLYCLFLLTYIILVSGNGGEQKRPIANICLRFIKNLNEEILNILELKIITPHKGQTATFAA